MRGSWVASDACILPTAEQPLRMAEFDALFADHVVGVEPNGPTRATLLLQGGRGLEARVRDLAVRESGCCSFFTFTVSAWSDDGHGDTGVVRLEVAVPAGRAEILAALTDRAEDLSAARPS